MSSPAWSPQTVIRPWPKGQAFTIADATTGVVCFGGTGSGKTSGPGKHLAIGYLEAGFGGLLLTAKAEERGLWEQWAQETGRSADLVLFDASGRHRFNPLDWETRRAGEGGGLVINIVHLLMEIAGAVAKGTSSEGHGGGDSKFFEDALHLMLTELVALVAAAGESVTLPRLREIAGAAARTVTELTSRPWLDTSACAQLLARLAADEAQHDSEGRADLAEVFSYWTRDYPALSERTRSIIDMMFSMLVQPFLFRPLRRLFTTDSTITPEACFDGRVIIVDLPVQEFRLAGRVAQLAWKHCFQIAVMRREAAANRRPVFLWADECQNFVTPFDAEYQAVARSAGGATVYLTQNRESLRRVLGSDDTVDALLGNLQTKFFCQNSSTDTNEWAAKLLGERWVEVTSRSMAQSMPRGTDDGHMQGGSSRAPQKRFYVEEAAFAQLRRGGPAYEHRVSAIVYKGGMLADNGTGEAVPYLLLTFNQLR